ncbi:hypothetical protein [Solitalea koreensis]|uniref:Uncharacterized protein n=1 Tax=Solitalea koreensis TaxID=543615 RepID=A0A521C1G8_9SPHI|nr:hypothetical protein [Solitalea koreensis]SMO52661.1 hypothetical protein SAMN06265350_10379 [Solitalea koreensis]
MKKYILSILFFCFSFGVFAEAASFSSSDTTTTILAAKVDSLVSRADWLMAVLQETNNFTENLTPDNLASVPIGLKRQIGGKNYILAIENVSFDTHGGSFTAFMRLPVPGTNKMVYFMGRNIRFSSNGGIMGDARLQFLYCAPIPLSSKARLLTDQQKCFVDFNCNGFKRLGFGGKVEFSPDMLLPEKPDGKPDYSGTHNVTGTFETVANDFDDMLAVCKIEPFQTPKLPGFSFHVSDAVFDFSDLHNAPSMAFPKDYPNVYEGNDELWRGVYIRSVVVKMPQAFKNKTDDGKRIELGAQNLIIDDQGFSGYFDAKNLLTLKQGSVGKWAFSINSLGVGIIANQLKYASFGGEIMIPITKQDESFSYGCTISSDNEYLFAIQNLKATSFDVFKAANVQLYPSSSLTIKLVDDQFNAKAVLNGKMDITPSLTENPDETSSANKFTLAEIEFEHLTVQTEAPFITFGAFALTGNKNAPQLAGFPLTVKSIKGGSLGDKSFIGVDLGLNIGGGGEAGFKADTRVNVCSKMVEVDGLQRWIYDKTQLEKVLIDADMGAIALKGSLDFFKEAPIYGSGFHGTIDARFSSIEVKAHAMFGKVGALRYWNADALMTLEDGIPLAGAFKLNGFGGGAYKGMLQTDEPIAGGLGKMPSGMYYVPDEKLGLGVRAAVQLSAATKAVFNGTAMFEMAFNKNGGLNRELFLGNANFITPPAAFGTDELTKLAGNVTTVAKQKNVGTGSNTDNSIINLFRTGERGSLSADLSIDANIEEKSFFAGLKTIVNVADVLKGTGRDNLAGDAAMYFSPSEWFIKIGTPEEPIGLELLHLARANAYFMVGNKIPGSPPPPAEVASILGESRGSLDYMRDFNALGTGKGIAFGANLKFDTGDLSFLMFYARFQAGLGFDMMLKDYGEASCVGRTGPVGINGWYANGQVYGYFEGKIGIRVNLFMYKGNFDIVNIGGDLIAGQITQSFLDAWNRRRSLQYSGGINTGELQIQVYLGRRMSIASS